jgi:osmoprotectant transport system permease protein
MSDWFDLYGQKLIKATFVHLGYVLVCVSIAFVIALILGIALSRIPKFANSILSIISVFQTIPGIVFVGILFLYFGMIPLTIIIALTVYAIFPILKNTFIGLIEVPLKYIDAARGCGMSKFQSLFKVELPLAMPTVIGGLRIATVYTVSWAVLSTMIGLGGLGEFIYIGINTNNNTLIVAGAIPAAIMAIVLSLLIDKFQHYISRRNYGKKVST